MSLPAYVEEQIYPPQVLPAYNTPVSCSTALPPNWHRAPMALNVPDPTCKLGSFIVGTINLVPRSTITPESFTVFILNRERAGLYGEVSSGPRVIQGVFAVSKLPNTSQLCAGRSYTIPFSIKFPENGWLHECKCGAKQPHTILPPSYGKHRLSRILRCSTDYILFAHTNCQSYCAQQYLDFRPERSVPLDITTTSTCPLPKTLNTLFSKVPHHILVQCSSLLYSPGIGTAPITSLKLQFIADRGISPPKISKVEYKVTRNVTWYRKKSQKKPTTLHQLVYAGESRVSCTWSGNHASLAFPVEIKAPASLEITYRGCITSIAYNVRFYFAGTRVDQYLVVGTEANPEPVG